MGTASTSIRLRESQANTTANVIETANNIWQALEDAGMVRVSNSSYSGQAGRLVSGTAGADQTQFATLGVTSGQTNVFYNVYKHPTLNFYVKVFVVDAGTSAATSRFSYIRFGVFFDLDGAGSHVVSGYTDYAAFAWLSGTNIGTASNQLQTTYRTTYVSVGDDHFLVCGDAEITPRVANGYPNTYWYAPGKLMKGIGVFADTDGANSLVVVMPSYTTNANESSAQSSFFNGHPANTQYNNANQFTAVRYWTYEPGVKVPVFRGGAAAGFIVDPATPSTGVGTRVQQAQLYIGGVLRKFNFGFVAEAAVTDSAVITLDLSGAGAQKYRVAKGFGPANPGISGGTTDSNYDTTSNSCIILPWNAP